MSARKSQMPMSYKLFLLVLLVAVTSLGAFALHHRSLLPHRAQYPQAAPQPVQIDSLLPLVPVGAPLLLSNVAIASETLASKTPALLLSSLTVRLTAISAEPLTDMSLILFTFDENKRLRQVNSWTRHIDLAAGKAIDLTLPLNQRVAAGQRFVLAIERAHAANSAWNADLTELAQGAASVTAGLASSARASQQAAFVPDTGAALCSNGFRRARALGLAGDGGGLTSFTCNQTAGSFAFSFNGKSL